MTSVGDAREAPSAAGPLPVSIGEYVSLLTMGISSCAFYFRGHARVVEAARRLAAVLARPGGEVSPDGVFLGVVAGRLVFEGKPLVGPSVIAKRLIDAARILRCGGFLLKPGADEKELREFFGICGETKHPLESLEETRRLFSSRGITSIVLSPPYGEPGWLGRAIVIPGVGAVTTDDVAQVMSTALPIYQSLLETVETVHASAEKDASIDVNGARGQAESFVREIAERPADLFQLTQYPTYDSYTVNHSVRVALLAVLAGQRVGLPEDRLVELGTAGLLHDVGKGKIPHEILFKQGPLDKEEKRTMVRHSILGAQVLIQNQESSPLAINSAYGHHIRYDRRGYPLVPEWLRPSRLTYLLQVCDVFEALTAVRPYKPSLTPRRAYEIILSDKGAFDPSAFREFVGAIGLYPPGWRVRLTTGEEALVLRAGSHIARPVVEICVDASGRPVRPGDRPVVDIGQDEQGRAVHEILRGEETVVEADPADYENRPTTLMFQCRHEGKDITCDFCAA
jgi:HD-GYP domain-containing protein (c-di-GMP phosphodiesterase class II)